MALGRVDELMTPGSERGLVARRLQFTRHGLPNVVRRAGRLIDEIDSFEDQVDGLEVPYANLPKFVTAAHAFAVYIAANADSLINYGERFRSGERISSAFGEATVNAVVSKRFAKKQQMQWIPRGAHLLLQTRTRTLDGRLRPLYRLCEVLDRLCRVPDYAEFGLRLSLWQAGSRFS